MGFRIRSGDTVKVIAGKDKGKIGKVKKVYPEKQRVLVEEVNVVKRHLRPRGPNQPSGIVEMAAPIHISNVMLVCPNCGEPTRVGYKFLEDGTKARFCKKCGEVI
jgi:large subunit ribosomal protein L24